MATEDRDAEELDSSVKTDVTIAGRLNDLVEATPGLLIAMGFVAVVLLALGDVVGSAFYTPVRLHFVGEMRPAIVESCREEEWITERGGGILFWVRVKDLPTDFPVSGGWRTCPLAPGASVQLLYNERMKRGIVLPGGTSLFHVLYHAVGTNPMGALVGIAFHLLLWMVLAAFVVGSACFQLIELQSSLAAAWHLHKRAPHNHPAVALSEFLVDCFFVFVVVAFLLIAAVGLARAIFLLEGIDMLFVGAVVIAVTVCFVCGVPLQVLKLLLALRQGPLFDWIGNIVVAAGLWKVTDGAIQFLMGDARFDSLPDMLVGFVEALF